MNQKTVQYLAQFSLKASLGVQFTLVRVNLLQLNKAQLQLKRNAASKKLTATFISTLYKEHYLQSKDNANKIILFLFQRKNPYSLLNLIWYIDEENQAFFALLHS